MDTYLIPKNNRGTCHNLCPDTDSGLGLIPAAMPAAVASGGWTPRAVIRDRRGSAALLVSRDKTIGVVSRGTVVSQITLHYRPLSFHPVDGRVIIVTECDRYSLVRGDDGTLVISAEHRLLEAVNIRTVAAPTVTAELPSMTLGGTYDTMTRLTDTDAAKIYRYLCDAYSLLYDKAGAAGRYMQPMVARLRFRTADGAVAFESRPVLLAHPEGREFSSSFDLPSRDSHTILPHTVERPTWRMVVDLPAVPSLAHIVMAEVVVSPQLANVDIRESGIRTVLRPHSTVATGTLVSATLAAGPAASLGTHRAVCRLAAALDDGGGRVVATISMPFESDRTVAIAEPVAPYRHAYRDLDALDKVLDGPIGTRPLSVTLLTPPHLCLPGLSAASAGAVLWADMRVRLFDGFHLASLAASTVDKPWYGYMQVRFADGTEVVRRSSGKTGAPVSFSPLLSYPLPDAVSVTLAVRIDGETPTKGTYMLDCDESRRMAAYVSAGMRPLVPPPAAEYVEPPVVPLVRDVGPCVACAPLADPFRLSPPVHTGLGAPCTLVPARFGQSSWDFGRVRFYAAGSAGIHSVSVSADRRAVSASLLDPRPVTSVRAAVPTPEGVAVVAGTDLVLVRGTAVQTVCRIGVTGGLLWDNGRHELWCVDGSDRVTVMCPYAGWGRYTLGLRVDPARLLPAGDGGWCASDEEVYDLSLRVRPAVAEIEWRGIMPSFARSSRMARLTVGMRGRAEDLHVVLRRSWLGTSEPGSMLAYAVSGDVRAPLSLRFRQLPVAGVVDVSVRGTVGADFVISSLNIAG